MAISTLILGESGTGKSASLRNLSDENTLLIQCQAKPLPFKNRNGLKAFPVNNWEKCCKYIIAACERGKEIIVIDDFQYLMAHEFMMRAPELGFTKFTEIALHAYNVIQTAINAPPNVRIYFLSHTDQNDLGKIKAKTIGKMLDDKITLEGLFSICLRTHVENGSYKLSTQNNGNDTVKSPMGLFDNQFIDNDLHEIDDMIKSYYEIN